MFPMKHLLILALAVPAIFVQAVQGQTATYRFDKFAEGVYLAVPATRGQMRPISRSS